MTDEQSSERKPVHDGVDGDPDVLEDQGDPNNTLPTAGDTEIGETQRLAEEEPIYEASNEHGFQDGDRALGGSEGTAEGQ